MCKDRQRQFIRDFTSPTTNRTGPVSIVLPPGYYDPANAGERYPVVYFMHGYGMDPQGLVDLGALVWFTQVHAEGKAATIEMANRRADGSTQEVTVVLRIDTPIEVDYYQHGGILPFVLRQLLAA